MNKILIDTNILIYAYDSQSAFHQRAVALLSKSGNELYVTTKNIAEFFAVLTKLSEPYQKIFEFYESIKSNTILLFPDPNSLIIFENLLRKYQPVGNRVFDIEIVSIALSNQIPTIATINTKDFSRISEISILPI